VTLWEFIPGDTLGYFRARGLSDEKVAAFRDDPENFIALGRMFVFDAAILNEDRFKLAFNAAANSGNLMVSGNEPVGLDQDFAQVDQHETPGTNLDDYGGMVAGKMQALLADPNALATALVKKMVAEEYYMFTGMEELLATGVAQGLKILRGLAAEQNVRLETLVAWSKTFNSETDLDANAIRGYWNSLLPTV
jgi:hypothetical protein